MENATKVRSTSEELDEIKQKVHRNKMILKELKTLIKLLILIQIFQNYMKL